MDSAKYAAFSEGLLAPLLPWFLDAEVSEIMLNRPKEIIIEKQGRMKKVDLPELNENMLNNLFQLIANENNQEISEKKPLLSGSLLDGSRIQLVKSPTSQYDAFSIRRQVVKNFGLNDYKKSNFYQKAKAFDINTQSYDALPDSEKELITLFYLKNWDEFIKRAILFRKNIVISGGTSSGKTTYLNACLSEIDLNDRVIILEDTREINIAHHNKLNLLVTQNDQGLSKVSMQDLVQCTLRLRPDRIIMGEIRGREIMDFVSASSTGHEGSMTTIHANNPKIAFMRMTQMYKLNNVPSMSDADIMQELKEVIDIIIQINKTTKGRLAHSIYYKYMHLKPK